MEDGRTRISGLLTGAGGRKTGLLMTAAVAVLLLFAAQSLAQEIDSRFTRINLVSKIFGRATFADSRLTGPWGLINSPDGGPWWVVDEGKGLITVYSGGGVPLPGLSPLAVTVPVIPGGIYDNSTPTGVVMNPGGGFELAPGSPAKLIFVTKDGSIAAWSSDVDPNQASVVVDNSPEASYTGAAIAEDGGVFNLYAANFRQGRIDVFDTNFKPVLQRQSAFVDRLIPDDFSPYNAQNIGGELYVTFARKDSDGRDAAYGEGEGFVDIFDTDGGLVIRLEHGPWMNAPWAVVLSPDGFGKLGEHVLVGNSGSGKISLFDYGTGAFEGYLKGTSGSILTIPGVRGMGFGNAGIAGPETALYFTAADKDTGQNIFGMIIPSTEFRRFSAQSRGLTVAP